jgi:hypothetical protein
MAVLVSTAVNQRRRMRAARILAGAVVALFTSATAVLAQPAALEYAVKANYLYKFGPFVGWPSDAFANAGSPFKVCVLGEDPFGAALDEATRGQTVAGHPVVVRRLQGVSVNPDCHVVYVGRSRAQKPAEVLRMLRDQPVLTVTDEGQGVTGGIIHFVLRDGRVRFEIDTGAAQVSGLALSSKLLGLAAPPRGRG